MKTSFACGIVFGIAAAAPRPALAQAPGTDIWIAPMVSAGPELALGTATNITARPGYDNQPSFTPDGETLLYTVIGSDGQAESFAYDLTTGQRRRLTVTPESEYSPTVTPGSDRFSVVRVEADSAQRLWTFAIDGSDPRLLLPDIMPVGYHVWIDPHTVAVFVLGNPATLHISDLETGSDRVLATNIGRTLHRVSGQEGFTFLQHGDGASWITAINHDSGASRPIAPAFAENEFFTSMPDGTLLTARDRDVFAWRDGAWHSVATLDRLPGAISRLAVSPDGSILAVVANESD